MEQVAADAYRAFFFHAMEPGEALEVPFGGEPYAALVWSARRTTDAQKARITQALIASGCGYVVCGGAESERWEDAADEAYLDQNLPHPVPDDRFVMTTSHPGEPPDEVVFFLTNATRLHREFARYLVLLVGDDDAVRQRLIDIVRHEAGV